MFSDPEIKFIQKELGSYVGKAQALLDKPDVEGEKRKLIEFKLITAVSIINKIIHSQPEADSKSAVHRMLIVDDVDSMRQIHKHFFINAGFKNVDVAENGARALQMMKTAYKNEKPYQLVISDWEMPRMTGLELLKETRTDKDLWKTPFYLISSLSDKKHIVKCINTGATGYMVKPVNQKMIKETFEDYLNK